MRSKLFFLVCLFALAVGVQATKPARSAGTPPAPTPTSGPPRSSDRHGTGPGELAPWARVEPAPDPASLDGRNGAGAPWARTAPITRAASGAAAGDTPHSNLYLPLITAPSVPSTIKSDDFHAATLNTAVWQFVNPVGDATLHLNGTNALISVPAGKGHDIWTDGNLAPRLMQAANNTNFEIEAKFETAPSGTHAMQGLLVQADSQNFLRFEFYSVDSDIHMLAASFADGAPTVRSNQGIAADLPLYMRVRRVGDQWTQLYSYDGANWANGATFTQTMAVTSVGFYGANAGSSPPAYTGSIDYFFNTAAPIVPEDGGQPPPPPGATPTLTPTPGATPTLTPPGSSNITSDDFNTTSLNTAVWQLVNPVGDATLHLNGTDALISVPAGTNHDIWTAGNFAPRLMQAASNTDFEIEVKFESAPSGTDAMQGLLVQADSQNFVRFDFYSVDTSLNIFAVSFADGTPSVRSNQPIDGGLPLYMRVRRVGDQWTQFYSYDGANWITNVSFTHMLAVTSVGFFVANAGSSPPAYTGSVDYFFNTAAPIVPEDANQSLDTTPPAISNLQYDAQAAALAVSWATDELAAGKVEYGTTTAYELGSVQESAPAYLHSALVGGLQPNTTYHFRVVSTDGSNHASSSANQVIRTKAPASNGPTIDVWYGSDQVFGQHGNPQQWANILGQVSDPDGVASLVYSLNGGAPSALSIGPDTLRLAAAGDFNAEIDYADLSNGLNSVVLTATDTHNNQSVKTIHIQYTSGQSWPLPAAINWGGAASIQQVAQVVDGLWTLEGDSLRPMRPGYDRLVDVGDISWTDYEVTVPITIHRFDPAGFAPTSGGPGVGILLRWKGHYAWGGHQPRYGYWPMGALGWYRWSGTLGYRLNIVGNNEVLLAEDQSGRKLAFDVRYIFKVRVESRPGQTSQYRLKVWQDGAPEPAGWDLTAEGPVGELGQGSVLLLAHHTDANFGDVSIVPVTAAATALAGPRHKG